MNRWGSGPMTRLRLPMIGQAFGPSGKLAFKRQKQRRSRRVMRMKARVARQAAKFEAHKAKMMNELHCIYKL